MWWKTKSLPEAHYADSSIPVYFFAEVDSYEDNLFDLIYSSGSIRKGETLHKSCDFSPKNGGYAANDGIVAFRCEDFKLSSGYDTICLEYKYGYGRVNSVPRKAGYRHHVLCYGWIPYGSKYYINEDGEVLSDALEADGIHVY